MRKLLVFFFIPINCFAQNTIGLPDVINYPKKTYAAGLQNWDIKQDKNNYMPTWELIRRFFSMWNFRN